MPMCKYGFRFFFFMIIFEKVFIINFKYSKFVSINVLVYIFKSLSIRNSRLISLIRDDNKRRLDEIGVRTSHGSGISFM